MDRAKIQNKHSNEQKISLLTTRKINKIKTQTYVNFPQEYINFLRVFGEGAMEVAEEARLPGEIRFYMLSIKWSEQNIIWFKDALVRMNGIYKGRFDTETKSNLDLLNNSFMFGDSTRSEIFLWDLRTYKSEDDSYDIHKIYLNSFSSDCVGRNFYEFVNNFCFSSDYLQLSLQGREFNFNNIYPMFTCTNYKF